MILADQCVFEVAIRALEEAGIKITRLRGVASPELPDPEVLALASTLDDVLLTEDKDFSSIVNYPPEDHGGVIVVRGLAANEEKVIENLVSFIQAHSREDLRGKLIIVDATKVRIRSQSV